MSSHRGALFSMVLSAAVVCVSLYCAAPVEARINSAKSAMGVNIFSGMPFSDHDEFLSQAAASQKNAKLPDVPLPDGAGKDLTQKSCGNCHANNVWTSQHHTRAQWNSIIDNMVSKGMKASDDDLDTIADYLAANFGPAAKTPPPGSEPPPPSRP